MQHASGHVVYREVFGFEPSDADVDECIVDVAKKLANGAGETYDHFFLVVHGMANGDLKHKHFVERMLALRGRQVIILFKDKVNGKGRVTNLYRLRVDSDNERPRWKT